MTPIISLCVLTYNRAEELETVVKSFLWQNYKDAEIVIVDDCSPDNTKQVVQRWVKISKRIRYIRNKKNIGLSANFAQSFRHCKGKYVIFLGDDDFFINANALKEYVLAFKNKNVGVVRARHMVFRNSKVYQASTLDNFGETKVFKEGNDALENILLDSITIAGLAFLNNNTLKKIITASETMYPQVELVMKMCLFYKASQINNYLIGVGRGKNQLNVIAYSLHGFRTNVIDDLLMVYFRIKEIAGRNRIKILSREKFLEKIISLISIFIPNNSIVSGKKVTLLFMLKLFKLNKKLILSPLFILAILLSILPRKITELCLSIINIFKLKMTLSAKDVLNINTKVKLLEGIPIV